ncbi:CCR4-NOT transcription complex subunit 10-like [Glandiceps talaboti]
MYCTPNYKMAESGDFENKPASPAASPVPAISEEEKTIAQACMSDFESGQYGPCITKLNNLAGLRPSDFKVTHNKTVAEFYQSGCTRTDEFKQALLHICQQAQVSLEDNDTVEDVDHAILFYNQAIIRYHLRQYREAAKILEKLFQFIEPLEESLAHKVLFLLIEVYLCTHQPDKAVPSLAYLEKLLYGGNGNKGDKDKSTEGSLSQQSSRDRDNKDGGDGSPSPFYEKYKLKLHMYKARIYLQLKSMKNCKREIKSVMTLAGMTAPACFIKSNFEYLRQNYRKAIKLLNSAPESGSVLKTGECRSAMYYNNQGCVHFYMRKYNLSAYYFRKALQENENALQELPKRSSPHSLLSGRPLCTLAINKRYELLHNSGITLLHAGRPLAAFDCLIEAVQVYHSNARLWLRLAECCIAANKGSPEEEPKGLPSAPKKGIVQAIIGSGKHRKIILGSSDNKYSSDGQSAAMPVATLEFASICLRNALSLLSEQETSTPPATTGASNRPPSESEQTSTTETSKLSVPAGELALPGAPLKPHEVDSLRCSVLANSAYVCLGLGDNLSALEHAITLLKQPRLSGSHKFLGHLYAAEALVSLDRIADAVGHLSPDNVTDVSVICPNLSDSSGDKSGNDLTGSESSGDISEAPMVVARYFPASIQLARATLLFNLASAHCLRSEYEKARRCLHQACMLIPPQDIPQQALLLGVYLELQHGNTPLALQMIKKNQLLPYVKISESRHSISSTPTVAVGTVQAPIGRKIRK